MKLDSYPRYDPIYYQKDLILGSGSSIIVTGWTPKERVQRFLEEKHYAVIGNLYSASYGLTPFFVNLLANPLNWDIFCLSGTKQDQLSGSTKCLFDLLSIKDSNNQKTFVNKDGVLIPKSEFKGRVENVITEEELDLIINSLGRVTFCRSVEELVSAVKLRYQQRIYKNIPLTHFTQRVQKTIPTTISKQLPGQETGQVIRAKTISESWLKAVYLVRTNGYLLGNLQELMQLTIVITEEPKELVVPEWLSVDRKYIENYIPQMLEGDNCSSVSYTYGNRIRKFSAGRVDDTEGDLLVDQLDQIASNLKNDQDSKRCWISLWDVFTDKDSPNPPCLGSLWFRIVNQRLVLVATFRSNDVYSAYPANLYALKKMQFLLLELLKKKGVKENLECGDLVVSLHSAHIYSHSFKMADEVIADHYQQKCINKELKDAVGNFVISWEDGLVVVVQTDLDGKPINVYRDKNTLRLLRKICLDNPSVDKEHSGYLGYELAKASLLQGDYKQDSSPPG